MIDCFSLLAQIDFEGSEEEATSNGYIPPDAPIPNRGDAGISRPSLRLPIGPGWTSPGEGWDPPAGEGSPGWSSLGGGWAPPTGWDDPGSMEGRMVDGQPQGKMPPPYERVRARGEVETEIGA